ncbi:MAG TPA: GDP-mannose 4,6-dehydratase, partial [Acidimicrobiales bacterium]|nr:GDP-mannose 4,6-dehydratase [Acidimicrobiales bacterium]
GGTIYGDPDPVELPLRETHPQRPVSPYGVAKKAVGDYLAVYRQLHDLEYTALALANIYGPRQNAHGEAGVVAIFAERMLTGQPCTIFGDGAKTRDYTFVDDTVDAFARAGDRADGLLLNIGTGTETADRDLYATVARAAGVGEAPVHAPDRPGDLRRSCLDPSRAGVHLGWRPWTSVEAGVAATVEWFRGRARA